MHIRDMLIGYARVFTDDQDLTLQRAALKEVGCRRTFEEKVSGGKRDQIALGERLVGGGMSVREAAKLRPCHHATLYRALSAPAA